MTTPIDEQSISATMSRDRRERRAAERQRHIRLPPPSRPPPNAGTEDVEMEEADATIVNQPKEGGPSPAKKRRIQKKKVASQQPAPRASGTSRKSRSGELVTPLGESPPKPELIAKDSPDDIWLSEIPANVTPDFSFVKLRHPGTDGSKSSHYSDVDDLDDDNQVRLEEWWNHFQAIEQGEPFRRWWENQGARTACCGTKLISKTVSDWPNDNCRCKSCSNARKNKRPCFRLSCYKDSDGQRHRVVAVMPEPNQDLGSAFEYWGESPTSD